MPAQAQVAAGPASATKPNIVIILADDLGWGDVRAMNPNSSIATPNIDSIAASGMRFSDAHSPSSVCSPTRYGLLTGRYGWRTRLTKGVLRGYSPPLIEPDRPTLGTLLQARGYRTAAIGKWHLGMAMPRLPEGELPASAGNPGIDFGGVISDSPVDHGFDEFFGLSGGPSSPPYVYIRDDRFTAIPVRVQHRIAGNHLNIKEGPLADDFVFEEMQNRLVEEAVAFVDRASRAEQPFFLYLPLTAPHVPIMPDGRFRKTTSLGLYGDFVAQLDDAVGQVLSALEEAGVLDDTLLVFTSDNGSYMGVVSNRNFDHTDDSRLLWYRKDTHRANGPWRGRKKEIFEGGHRVPLLVRWPGVVAAGSETAATVTLTDLYATVADIVGEEALPGVAEDSMSLLPILRSESETRGVPVVHHSVTGMFAVRDGPWKLVLGNGTGGHTDGYPWFDPSGSPFQRPWRLYDLSRDPAEADNIAGDHPDVVARLEAVYESIVRADSHDATLSALSLSGIDIGAFSGDTTAYAASVAHEISSTTVTAAARHARVSVSISPGTEVSLAVGANDIAVTATAEDGFTTKTYTVTVTRAALPEASIAAGASPVTEGTAASFTVTLDQAAPEALTVSVSVTESGSALSVAPPASVAFAKGETSARLAVPTAGDSVVETDSTVTATVAAGTGYTVGTASSASVTVEDDDAATFTVSAEPESLAEGETATLAVAIANRVTFAEDQTISLAASGTASASDYTGVPAALTLAAGTSSVMAGLAASKDQDEEEAETVTITASHNGSPIGSATVAIHSVSHDATLGTLSLSGIDIGAFSGAVTSYQASVGHSVATTTVTATATHSAATVSIAPGSEVSLAVGANAITVTVTAEDGSTTKTYTVTVTRAALPEASIAAGASPVPEGTAASFTVVLDQAAPVALTVAVSVTASGSALSGAPPASVAFAKGETSARLAVPTAGDSVVETDSTVTATVTAGTGYTVGPASSASVTVEDDDAATFTVSAEPESLAEGETATLAVAIANGVTFAEDQKISLAASGTASASDYAGVPATLTLAAGASSAKATLTASVDQEEEEAETVTITASHDSSSIGSATIAINSISHDATLGALSLSGIDIGAFSGAVTSYQASVGHSVATTTVRATATHSAATVSIAPGSEVSLAVGENEIAVTVTAEDGSTTKTYAVTVTRAEAPALPVVSIAAVEERVVGPIGEFTVSRTGPTAEALDVRVLFTNSRSSRTQTLTIRLLPGRSSATTRVQVGDNGLVEDDITVTYTLREGEGYTVSAERGSASVVLEESDIPEFSVSARPAGIAEGESAAVRVAITNGVRFREAQTIDLSVSGTASGSDYAGVPETLTLRAYKTSTAAATLTAAVDREDEAEETVTITASHGGSEIGSATVTITGAATPLKGRFAKMPATHDGETRFSFELHFSEEIRISYKTLRDKAFTVTGGAVRKARRLAPPSNLGWEITVEPASDADIELVLPETTDCAAARAVCTAAGKRLSGRLAATVPGPGTRADGLGFSLAPENGRPSGIWSDGATAWVADLDDGKLFAYQLSDGSRSPERDLGVGGSPMGLWSDGATLWVAELTGGLAAHRLSDGSRLPGRDLALPASASPVGVWSDGETVWIAEWLGDTVHGYRLSDGERAPARDIRLAAGNLLPVGLWSDGETLWVADWNERMVAYRLSDGERAPERDVAAKGPDADPSGLWSDGETLLATGWEGGEVRAHALPAAAGRAVAAARAGEPGAVPPIGDPALRAAIMAALGAQAGAEGLAGLEVLDARHGGIRSLAGLEGAVNLKELDLGFNPLDDARALAELPSLQFLNLDGAAAGPLRARVADRPRTAVAPVHRRLRPESAGRVGAARGAGRGRQPHRGPPPARVAPSVGGPAGGSQPHRGSVAARVAAPSGGGGPGAEPHPRLAAAGGAGSAPDAAAGRQWPLGALSAGRARGLAGTRTRRQRRRGPRCAVGSRRAAAARSSRQPREGPQPAPGASVAGLGACRGERDRQPLAPGWRSGAGAGGSRRPRDPALGPPRHSADPRELTGAA